MRGEVNPDESSAREEGWGRAREEYPSKVEVPWRQCGVIWGALQMLVYRAVKRIQWGIIRISAGSFVEPRSGLAHLLDEDQRTRC